MNTRSADAKKQWVKDRVNVRIDEEHYEYYPETEHTESYDNDAYQRVGIYARVSTDDTHQTLSFELQKKYYEDFVIRHPNWELVDIYADEGISGTSLKKRDAFNRMIADAKAGKLDLIITKSVSRFARNVVDFLGMVRMLAEHNPSIGVFFEAECIYSLNERSQMALSFQATMAEEESRNKSRSMETSLRMRLDHGLPLTPELLGYMHDEDGHLTPNPDTAHIPKLIFFMYLYGYSTSQIAEILTELGKRTYRGNMRWSSSGITQTLKNERYCGDVFTRKTYTPDVISHRSVRNQGQRPRSRYLDWHPAIVSRDDFIAVQHMLHNAKYGNRSILPELQVIREGLLKGYVIINPRWGSFTAEDYRAASASAYDGAISECTKEKLTVEAEEGDFDFSGYEIALLDLMGMRGFPMLYLEDGNLKFSSDSVKKMPAVTHVELLVHPGLKSIAIRPAKPENRHAVNWIARADGVNQPRSISAAAFSGVLFSLFGWDTDHKYRLYGTHYKNNDEEAMIFATTDAVVMIRKTLLEQNSAADCQPLAQTATRVGAVTGDLSHSFGKDFYREQTEAELVRQTRENWQIRLEGRLCSSGRKLNITPYEELKAFIREQLGDLFKEDDPHVQ